jgi:hypothetical protein
MPRQSSSALGRKIAQSTGIVMASVLLSRILGFCREWAVAHQVGSNAITDAYYAAFTLPDFRNIWPRSERKKAGASFPL